MVTINSRRNGHWAIEMPHVPPAAVKTPAALTKQGESTSQGEKTPEQEAYHHLLKFSGAIFVFVCCFMAVGFVITIGEHQGTPQLLAVADAPDFVQPDAPSHGEYFAPPKAETIFETNKKYSNNYTTDGGTKHYYQDNVGVGTEKHNTITTTTNDTRHKSSGKFSSKKVKDYKQTTQTGSNSMTGFKHNPNKKVSFNVKTKDDSKRDETKNGDKVQKLDKKHVQKKEGFFTDGMTQKDDKNSKGFRGAEIYHREETRDGFDETATGSKIKKYNTTKTNTSVVQGEYGSQDSEKGRIAKLDIIEQSHDSEHEKKNLANGQKFTGNKKDTHERKVDQRGPANMVDTLSEGSI